MCFQSPLFNGIIAIIVGLVFSVATILLGLFVVPQFVENVVRKSSVLEEDTPVWNIWKNPPFIIHTDFYIFNCTNVEEVLTGAVPRIKELGPYSFREYREKDVEKSDESTVFYRENRLYYFDQNRSGSRRIHDVITTVNPIYMAASKFLMGIYVLNTTKIEDFLKARNQSVFMTATVDQLLFKGLPLLPYIELYQDYQMEYPILDLPDLPESITGDPFFTFFSMKNETNDGLFEVNRGVDQPHLFGHIESWNQSPYVNFWSGNESYCNHIKGTDGTIFPPQLNLTDRLYIYQTDLCRSVYAVYEKDDVVQGLSGHRFVLPRSVLAHPSEAPENTCFCTDPTNQKSCLDTGVIDLGSCYGGAPLIGSAPHFYNGDNQFVYGVIGLIPEKEKHETFLIFETRTSVILRAIKRFQISVHMNRYRLPSTDDLRNVFLPVFWYQETIEIDEETASNFNIFTTIHISLGLLVITGIILIITGSGFIVYHFKNKNSSDTIERRDSM